MQHNHRQDKQKLTVTFAGGLLLLAFSFLSAPSPSPVVASLRTLVLALSQCMLPSGSWPLHTCSKRFATTAQHLLHYQTPGKRVPTARCLFTSQLISAPSSNTSFLPRHAFFRHLLPSQLPQDHLFPRAFLKRHYPKHCKHQVTWWMSSEQNSTSEGCFCCCFA